MKIYVIGSSLTSCYWNGAATYYRGIYKNLRLLGHGITFAEPDIYQRQQHRDSESIDYANVCVYQSPDGLNEILAEASKADLIIKHSGVGADDEVLEREVLNCRSGQTQIAFWDVDAPATLARVQQDPSDFFRTLVPQYDFIFTYGGGQPVVDQYLELGAKNCFPIYNGLDPDTHFPVRQDQRFKCDLAFVGNRMPDREARVEQFFFAAAKQAPELSFLLGGEGWGGKEVPANVRWIGHVSSADHNVINCSARTVLNINRASMAQVGFSPPTRVFEAAGAAACLITDAWLGVEQFFEPDQEILLAHCADDVVRYLRKISQQEAFAIGSAARARALRDHRYELRARQFDEIMHESVTPGLLASEPYVESAQAEEQ